MNDRVYKNQPTIDTRYNEQCSGEMLFAIEGIPLRLELASRFVAAMIGAQKPLTKHETICLASLGLADELIDHHNKTCGGVE